MTTPFSNPITGGQGALLRAAIKSPNFSIPLQTGWSIDKNGNAYFFSVTVTGDIIIASASGGIFIYNGPPETGDLIYSAVGQAGTDGFGNAVLAGETSYNGGGVINTNGGAIQIYTT